MAVTIPPLTTPGPNPNTQTPAEFNSSVQTFVNELPPTILGINSASEFIENESNEAQASALAASNSAATAAANANFRGPWSSLTGSLTRPASVVHNGATWQLQVASLADVTTSPPSASNTDWRNISPLANPFTTDGQIIISGPSGVIQTLNAPADNTGSYSLTYNSVTQTIAWGEGSATAGADIDATTLPAVGAGAATRNIDMSLGSVFVIDMSAADSSGALTITASNIPANGFNINLYIRRAGRKTINFPAGWEWNTGATPTLANGSNDYTLININRPPFFSATGAAMTVTTEQEAE